MITDSQQTSSPDIEAYLAMQLLKDGDRHAAINKCHEAISQYGPNRNLYLVKARAHLELEEYGFAQEALLSLLSLDPEHPAGWALLGEAYFQLGNMPKVDYCRNRLKQIFPTLTEPDEVEESNSADDVSGQATRRQDDIPVGQDPRSPDNIPIPAGEDTSRAPEHHDEPVEYWHDNGQPAEPDIPVGQADSRPEEIPTSGEPAASFVPLEEVSDTQIPPEPQPSESEPIQTDGIVSDLIETDLRINEKAEGTSKIDVEIFETATFADICLAQGKLEKALDIYTKLLMIHPDNAEYREKINSIQAKMGSR